MRTSTAPQPDSIDPIWLLLRVAFLAVAFALIAGSIYAVLNPSFGQTQPQPGMDKGMSGPIGVIALLIKLFLALPVIASGFAIFLGLMLEGTNPKVGAAFLEVAGVIAAVAAVVMLIFGSNAGVLSLILAPALFIYVFHLSKQTSPSS